MPLVDYGEGVVSRGLQKLDHVLDACADWETLDWTGNKQI